MGIRNDMQQAARRAPDRLGPEASARVASFLRGLARPEGGYANRAGKADLYYTPFAVDGLVAVGAEPAWDPLAAYLERFGGGEALDLVHVASLVRAWTSMPAGRFPDGIRAALIRRLAAFRAADGGYGATPGASRGDLYGCFLAVGMAQDLAAPVPDRETVLGCVRAMAAADGGYSNEAGQPAGITTVTAAAVVLMRELGVPVPDAPGAWLLARAHADGGFVAAPSVPAPDLLSTATALHALALAGIPLDDVREPCLDCLDALWDPAGAFRGSAADRTVDGEYTYYALLALGHLASP